MAPLKLISGNANRELALKIAEYLGMELADAEVTQFADGETCVRINENMRGADVFVIQPTCPPVNHNLMELLTLIDALLRASAQRITAVIPYYGYARQDRKVQPRVPITAKLVANLITAAGAHRILCMDLHVGQIQGFFDIPVDHLFAAPVFIEHFKKMDLENLVIVSPDTGGVERVRAFAKRLRASIAIIDKRRLQNSEVEVMNIIGDVRGKDLIIVDDIVDTATTLTKASDALKEAGAKRIFASCTHAVLSKDAPSKLLHSSLEKIFVTDTIPLKDKRCEKIEVLSVAPLLAEAIKRIHENTSVSSLFI